MQPVAPPSGREPLPPGGAPHLPAFSHAEFLEGLQKEELSPLLLRCFSNRVGLCMFPQGRGESHYVEGLP